MLPHASVTSHVTTTRSASSFTKRSPDMRGLKKTQIAGTVLARFAAPSDKGSKRPMETPPWSKRGPRPGPGLLPLGASPNRIDPVRPTENELQVVPEKGNAKL